jgi:cytochrome c-type biogenesis protein CcmH
MYRLWLSYICMLVILLLAAATNFAAAKLTWQDVAADLMSPACPGRTLINCTSGYAEQWRELIRQKIAQGETKDEIIRYFVNMRGEEILAAPPKRGFALTAWLFPIFVMLNGAGLIIVLTYRWAHNRPARSDGSTASERMSSPETADDDPYRRRLHRELEEFSDG